ncbi:ABC-type transport system, membrane protein [Candidatus Magnetoovum chiemensis]|nr:ABC-type transport system, membrane protein [Candidatus Magnetoovum chiemensis]
MRVRDDANKPIEQNAPDNKIAPTSGLDPNQIIEIRVIENDEVKFQQAYMGLVIIHGDMIEKIPAITSTDGLEYTLTSAVQKLNNKVSALLSLDEKIKIRLYLSSSLEKVAPLMGLDELSTMPARIEKVVEKLNVKTLDKIEYKYIDLTKDGNLEEIVKKYNLMAMKWPEIVQKNIAAGNGGAGIVIEYKSRFKSIPLISSINLPIIGTTYQMVDPEALDDLFTQTIETMIGINETIGYLADHGTYTLSDNTAMMMGQQQQSSMNAFNSLISQRYSIESINLKDSGDNNSNSSTPAGAAAKNSVIPEGLKTLIIARPTEPFSDYELFQIDQALMKGTNIAFFLDAFNEIMPSGQMAFAGPQYLHCNWRDKVIFSI